MQLKTGLPQILALSFITFHNLSYVLDVYRHPKLKAISFAQYLCYTSLFVNLLAGPILLFKDFASQNWPQHRSTWLQKRLGIQRFVIGLFSKVVISYQLGMLVDNIFIPNAQAINTFHAWLGSLAYTMQIYFDFSGYSNMAIGLGLIIGIKLPENFNYPYLSKSISEFWNRWHISLGAWFKEYVYFPMGGNRLKGLLTYRNILIVFLLTGIWHGANWTFIAWGLWHGLFVMLDKSKLAKHRKQSLPAIQLFITFAIVLVSWVVFRSPTIGYSLVYLSKMFVVEPASLGYLNIPLLSQLIPISIGLGLLSLGKFWFLYQRINRHWLVSLTWHLLLLMVSLISISASTYNPFIYTNF